MKKRMAMAIAVSSILIGGISWNYLKNKPKYFLHLPDINTLKSICIEEKKVEGKKEMQEILSILNLERTTKIKSIQDAPTNAKERIKISFYFENGNSILFIYKRNSKYYVEQPYNGIYKITKEEYKKIKDMHNKVRGVK